MLKIKLSVGLFDKDTKRQEVDTFDAVQLIESSVLATGVGGCSVWKGNGVYLHDDGSLVREPSVFCEVYGWTVQDAKKVISFLKKELNQESIALEVSEVKISFE